MARRELPGPADARAAKDTVGLDKFMWGSDYPHDEGTYPFARGPAPGVPRLERGRHAQDPRRERGALYDFDLEALAPLAEQFGPTVEELRVPLLELPDDANEALRRVGVTAV